MANENAERVENVIVAEGGPAGKRYGKTQSAKKDQAAKLTFDKDQGRCSR